MWDSFVELTRVHGMKKEDHCPLCIQSLVVSQRLIAPRQKSEAPRKTDCNERIPLCRLNLGWGQFWTHLRLILATSNWKIWIFLVRNRKLILLVSHEKICSNFISVSWLTAPEKKVIQNMTTKTKVQGLSHLKSRGLRAKIRWRKYPDFSSFFDDFQTFLMMMLILWNLKCISEAKTYQRWEEKDASTWHWQVKMFCPKIAESLKSPLDRIPDIEKALLCVGLGAEPSWTIE